nr:hypothetical protein [Tanacetum cinerariifolium]
MINKDNYVPWSSRIIRYARSRPNGKIIVDSIENVPYVRRMIATPGEPDLPVLVLKSLHEQTDEELTETDIKRMDADDQAIQTILLGLPKDVYAVVDSSDIGEQEKKAKLFNEWEKFMSTDVATQQWELFYINSGKILSSGIFITGSGNDLEHFIPNNPPLKLMLHLQSRKSDLFRNPSHYRPGSASINLVNFFFGRALFTFGLGAAFMFGLFDLSAL